LVLAANEDDAASTKSKGLAGGWIFFIVLIVAVPFVIGMYFVYKNY